MDVGDIEEVPDQLFCGRFHTGAYNLVPEPATNTGPDIVSMDVIWGKVLQVYVRCHLRGAGL